MEARKTGMPSGGERPDVPTPPPRDPRTVAIIDLLRQFTTAMDRYIDVRGGAHGMHRTDLHALAHVMDAARMGRDLSPGELASALNLSSPATSALLTRLESVGHVRRHHSASDRRRVSVEMTDGARQVGRAIFFPLGDAIAAVIAELSADQQETVLSFLGDVVDATNHTLEDTGRPTHP